MVSALRKHALLPFLLAALLVGVNPVARANTNPCLPAALDLIEAQHEKYFWQDASQAHAAYIDSQLMLLDDAESALPQFYPARYRTFRNSQGLVTEIQGRNLKIAGFDVRVDTMRYQAPITPSKLGELYDEAKKEARETQGSVRKLMDRKYVEYLAEQNGLTHGAYVGSGGSRVAIRDTANDAALWRIYKPYDFDKGVLEVLTPEEILGRMQRDQMDEAITNAIAQRELNAGRSKPWDLFETQWFPGTGTVLSRAGIFKTPRAEGDIVWDLLGDPKAAEKAKIPRALHDRLVRAKRLRDEVDSEVMAAHAGMYRVNNANFDLKSKLYGVGLDPNNGYNYLTDGEHLKVVDH